MFTGYFFVALTAAYFVGLFHGWVITRKQKLRLNPAAPSPAKESK